MGADYDCRHVKDVKHEMTHSKISEYILDMCKDSAYENGHGGYSGTFAEKIGEGVDFIDQEFDDYQSADQHIDENADKWGSIMVAKVKDKGWCVGAVCSS